jgi:hypothetical protein
MSPMSGIANRSNNQLPLPSGPRGAHAVRGEPLPIACCAVSNTLPQNWRGYLRIQHPEAILRQSQARWSPGSNKYSAKAPLNIFGRTSNNKFDARNENLQSPVVGQRVRNADAKDENHRRKILTGAPHLCFTPSGASTTSAFPSSFMVARRGERAISCTLCPVASPHG